MYIVWIIVFVILFVTAIAVYNFVLMPAMQKKASEKNNTLMDEFASSIRGNEDATRRNFIQSNELIKPIIAPIKDDEIEYIVSCMEMRGIKEFKKQMAVNLAAKAIAHGVGGAIRQGDNMDIYYLVFTKSMFYYLHFHRKGNFIQQADFERGKMQNLEVGTVTKKEMVVNAAVAKISERISFTYDDQPYKFFFYNTIYDHPNGKLSGDKDMAHAQIDYLFYEPFKKFIANFRTTG